MFNKRTILIIFSFLWLGIARGQLIPTDLQCEHMTDPLGIDDNSPCLSWELIGNKATRDQRQTAYQILVASSLKLLKENQADLWNSGKIESDQQLNIQYEGKKLRSGIACWWKVRVWDQEGKRGTWSDDAQWSMGLLQKKDWAPACWIADPDIQKKWKGALTHAAYLAKHGKRSGNDLPHNGDPATMLRKEFYLDAPVKRAIVYATALGLYTLQINGKIIGQGRLVPGWTDYDKRVQYRAYDVTALLQRGNNAMGVVLGEGWYAGRVPPGAAAVHTWGTVPRFLMKLRIEQSDGKIVTVVSDTSWDATLNGPIRQSGIYSGEIYDARKEMPGWSRPGFDDVNWKPVYASPLADRERMIVAQPDEPIRINHLFKPVKFWKLGKGEYVFDFGQNQTGVPRIKVSGPKGRKISMRYAEAVYRDGSLDSTSLRGLQINDTYILKGKGNEVWEPSFTYHGYRYIEVKGLTVPPTDQTITALSFHSAVKDAGKFECSNKLINEMMHATRWGLYSNLISVPLDCPQRAERLGWLGDAQVISQTAIYLLNMQPFYNKWLKDIRDDQDSIGGFPDFAPKPPQTVYYNAGRPYSFSPGWADGGIIIPWRIWVNYADSNLLANYYPYMKEYLDAIIKSNPNNLWTHLRGKYWGDWLALKKADFDLFSTAFYAHDCYLMSKMAKVLGYKNDANYYWQHFELIKRTFTKKWVGADGYINHNYQSEYTYALFFGLLNDTTTQRKALNHLLHNIRTEGHITTGIQSSGRMMLLLGETDNMETAYQLLTDTTMPSWGYMIKQGATTIWESWSAYSKKNGFGPGARSLNHYALGAVGEFIWRYIAGIRPDKMKPGYKHFYIAPKPDPSHGIYWAKAKYESVRGPIISDWDLTDNVFSLKVQVPPNASATVTIPTDKIRNVFEENKPLDKAENVHVIGITENTIRLNIGSGIYHFKSLLSG